MSNFKFKASQLQAGDLKPLSSGLYVRVKNYLGWIKKHAASGTCGKKRKSKKSSKKKKKKRKRRRKKSKKKKRKKKKKKRKRKRG